MDDLEQLLNATETETPTQASESQATETHEETKDPEVLRKEEQLANINRALSEANEELRRIRTEKKKLKTIEPDEELPKINFDDPSAKAWEQHIKQQVSPVQSELDQEKQEVRQFALKEFLSDKPALAASPEKVKELMATYDKLRSSSERTREGVLLDLEKSYAATFHQELIDAARGRRVAKAQANALFSDIAVSKGATSYASEDESLPREALTADERELATRWYGSVENYLKAKKEV